MVIHIEIGLLAVLVQLLTLILILRLAIRSMRNMPDEFWILAGFLAERIKEGINSHSLLEFIFPRSYREREWNYARDDLLRDWADAKVQINGRLSQLLALAIFSLRWVWLYLEGLYCCYLTGPLAKLLGEVFTIFKK